MNDVEKLQEQHVIDIKTESGYKRLYQMMVYNKKVREYTEILHLITPLGTYLCRDSLRYRYHHTLSIESIKNFVYQEYSNVGEWCEDCSFKVLEYVVNINLENNKGKLIHLIKFLLYSFEKNGSYIAEYETGSKFSYKMWNKINYEKTFNDRHK